jgi:CheY-like chemotaxis protein
MGSFLEGVRVLVVEDEMIVAWLVEDMLSQCGCTIVGPVGDLPHAFDTIANNVIDIALVDINLNGIESYPIADRLLEKHIPFIFTTGYEKDHINTRYRACPMLQKPYHHFELTGILSFLLSEPVL